MARKIIPTSRISAVPRRLIKLGQIMPFLFVFSPWQWKRKPRVYLWFVVGNRLPIPTQVGFLLSVLILRHR